MGLEGVGLLVDEVDIGRSLFVGRGGDRIRIGQRPLAVRNSRGAGVPDFSGGDCRFTGLGFETTRAVPEHTPDAAMEIVAGDWRLRAGDLRRDADGLDDDSVCRSLRRRRSGYAVRSVVRDHVCDLFSLPFQAGARPGFLAQLAHAASSFSSIDGRRSRDIDADHAR